MITKITNKGVNFIEKICNDNFQNLISGNNGALPFSDDGNGNLINKTWTSNVQFNGEPITNPTTLSEALVLWFNQYATTYSLDPNILAAQAFVESGYKLWYYSNDKENIGNSDIKSGINLFSNKILYAIIINNFGNTFPKFTQDEIDLITNGVDLPLSPSSYEPRYGDAPDIERSKLNRSIIHQNVIDHPQLMIKAQAKYLKYISDKCNKLASSTLFCYSRGIKYIDTTYSSVIQNARTNNNDDDQNTFLNIGLDYVLKVFGVLGDKSNQLPFKNYKPPTFYFGYDNLFTNDDLSSYPNNNFSAFDANTEESKEYNIEFLDDLSIVNNSNYKFIYFPANQYNQVEATNKLQIVLHHTVSGDKTGVGGDIKYWRDKGEKVATAFIIARDGNIYQLFNTDYWAYHLGLSTSNNLNLNQFSIGIEIDSWGGLVRYNNAWYPTLMDNDGDLQTFEPIKKAETVTNIVEYNSSNGYDQGFRGFFAFEKYTNEQINAVRDIIISLNQKFGGIDLTYHDDIWDFNNKKTGLKGISQNALNGVSGVWTHTSYRTDKSDCHPQPELVDMLKNLKSTNINNLFNTNIINNSANKPMNSFNEWKR